MYCCCCCCCAVPAPFCNDVESINGGLLVRYGFFHTGGQDLSSVALSYMIADSSTTQPGPDVGVTDVMATILMAVAGNTYTVYVTASNPNGSATVMCPQVVATSGKGHCMHNAALLVIPNCYLYNDIFSSQDCLRRLYRYQWRKILKDPSW